jgi:pantoate--beta-alanine ligase
MRVIHTADDLRDALQHASPAFVPTMGALHEGHLALIRLGKSSGNPVVVSIFVNPTQFGPNEDFSRYPRQLEKDIALAESAGADVIFAPDVNTVYPPLNPVAVPALPAVATQPKLEDAFRPTHFAGVCQVVARLFDLVQPSAAIFGEKDFQQLRVIEEMVAADQTPWPDLRIVAHETVRESDGLAMSSRNVYLQPSEREHALGLIRALRTVQQHATATISIAQLEDHMREILLKHGLSIDYAVLRDARTLLPVEIDTESPIRGLIAARLGKVRLIDNLAIR